MRTGEGSSPSAGARSPRRSRPGYGSAAGNGAGPAGPRGFESRLLRTVFSAPRPYSSAGERRLHTADAPGSIPGAGTGLRAEVVAVAQLVESAGSWPRRSPVRVRSVTLTRVVDGGTSSGPQTVALVADLGRHQGRAPCPRSSADRAPDSGSGAAGSIPAGDTHGRMPEWSGARLQNGTRRFESGFGLQRCHPLWSVPQESVGCSTAPHTGGLPGSTPGPATTKSPHRTPRPALAEW
jgi:hypothetical protein